MGRPQVQGLEDQLCVLWTVVRKRSCPSLSEAQVMSELEMSGTELSTPLDVSFLSL